MLRESRKAAGITSVIVILHVALNIGHMVAHQELGVDIGTWQMAYVAVVLGIAPIVAAALFWTSLARYGAILLSISMAASFLFGTIYHYIAESTDHVSHLPAGDYQGLFRSTAFFMALTQIAGLLAGSWAFRNRRPRTDGLPY